MSTISTIITLLTGTYNDVITYTYRYVIDNLKHRFKTLNLLLGRLGDDAEDRRGLLGVVLDYEDFTRYINWI